jgi:hypothetical protein
MLRTRRGIWSARRPTIKLGESSFPKAQLASLEPNGFGNILTVGVPWLEIT